MLWLVSAKRAFLSLPLLAFASMSWGSTYTFEVDAFLHSINSGFGSGLSTGIQLSTGASINITNDVNDTWDLGPFDTNADGNLSSNALYLTLGNLTEVGGVLVGQIGSGDYFVVGSNYFGSALNDGELILYVWDDYTVDNSGSITTQITIGAVPLPSSLLLLLSGGAAIFFTSKRRRKKRSPAFVNSNAQLTNCV